MAARQHQGDPTGQIGYGVDGLATPSNSVQAHSCLTSNCNCLQTHKRIAARGNQFTSVFAQFCSHSNAMIHSIVAVILGVFAAEPL